MSDEKDTLTHDEILNAVGRIKECAVAKIGRFEDLIAWQKAKDLAVTIYQTTHNTSFSKDYGLSRQIQRAAVSVMSNVAEGYERDSPREFHRFLSIAKGSCAEVRSQLYLAHDIGYVSSTEFDQLRAKAEEVARIIGGLRSSLARQRKHTKDE